MIFPFQYHIILCDIISTYTLEFITSDNVIIFLYYFASFFNASAAVSDQLKNARLTSSNSASHLRGLHSVHPTGGSLHTQDPLEAALLAAARGQHGTGIPGKTKWPWMKMPDPPYCFQEVEYFYIDLHYNTWFQKS